MIKLPYHRRTQRHAVEVPCSIVGSDWEEPVSFHASSLSAHGMFVPTSFPLRPGEHVVVSFQPPSANRGPKAWRQPRLTVFAQVARAVPFRRPGSLEGTLEGRPGMGLQFCDLTRQERRALQRCLASVPESSTADQASRAGVPSSWRPYRGRW